MTVDMLRAVLAAIGADADTVRRVRALCPDVAAECTDMLWGDFAPCAGIGPVEPARTFGAFDRDAIDASAEREGEAADWMADNGLSHRPRNGRTTATDLDYHRAARREAMRDEHPDPKRCRRYRSRDPYRRQIAMAAWRRICEDFRDDIAWRKYVQRGDWRPAWLRDESRERRAQRVRNKARRELIRLLGALSRDGNAQAAELYRRLQPAAAVCARPRRR